MSKTDAIGTLSRRRLKKDPLGGLYKESLPSLRTGALYTAFPYPTKISPDAIALFIAAHTNPGDTIFDGFAGSGTTGLAALLCENPSPDLRAKAKRLGLNVKWGPRNAVLYELSSLGSFIGRTLTNPPDPKKFNRAAEAIISEAEASDGWMYQAKDNNGDMGTIRYIVWADELRCPSCKRKTTLWAGCVTNRPACISSSFTCPSCKYRADMDQVRRLTKRGYDDVLKEDRKLKARVPVRMYGKTGKTCWSRPVNKSDLKLLARIAKEPIPATVPHVSIPWGDLYRAGYHEGITHLHHFYTRRNLIAFTRMWDRTAKYEGPLRDALRFWILSYNASHATIMTRVVAKAGQNELVVTSAQAGVLYVSGLPVEKNLFSGMRRKLLNISQAFETIHGRQGKVTVRKKSSCKLDLMDASIDYVFTDPPFGGNIPYAEVNFINEAWLNDYTDRKDEIIVSKNQEKSVNDYQDLMARALKEVYRVIKPKGKATVVFHSATAEIWNALQTAYRSAQFGVERASVLNKTQGSFKQVTTDGAVRGDPVLLLSKQSLQPNKAIQSVWKVAELLHHEARFAENITEQTPQRLYSRLVTHFLVRDQEVPVDADIFYQWLAAKRAAGLNSNACV